MSYKVICWWSLGLKIKWLWSRDEGYVLSYHRARRAYPRDEKVTYPDKVFITNVSPLWVWVLWMNFRAERKGKKWFEKKRITSSSSYPVKDPSELSISQWQVAKLGVWSDWLEIGLMWSFQFFFRWSLPVKDPTELGEKPRVSDQLICLLSGG